MSTHGLRWLWRWGPLLLWFGVISGFSTSPFSGEETSRFIQPLLRWLIPGLSDSTVELIHHGIRKMGHVIEFGVLAILWYRGLARGRRGWQPRWAFLGFGLTLLFAAVDEVHQAFVSTRVASVVDVGLDGLGALGGLALRSLLFGRAEDSGKAHAPEAHPPGRIETPVKG